MIKKILLLLCLSTACTTSKVDYAVMVDPIIGTSGPGNVYPGAQVPFGMVQLSPDNGLSGWQRISGYSYGDSTIAGFSHTHLSGTGAGDLYDILFMPAVRPYHIAPGELGLHSKFSHNRERASAGYYQVFLEDYGINVELTATCRGGLQRYTFPHADSALVQVNLFKSMNWDYPMGSEITVIDSLTIQGYRLSQGWATEQRVYFVTKFSKPFIHSHIEDVYTIHIEPQYDSLKNAIGQFYFATSEGEKIEVRTAISAVSIEGAYANFEAELSSVDFDKAHRAAVAMWNSELSKINVEGGTADERKIFYTALYRTMLAPTIFSDVTGNYFGADKRVHKADFTTYHTFSLWDTYRAEHPLLTILESERVADMVRSFLAFFDEHGALPVWNMWGNETDMMIGYHSIAVIAEAYLKGVPMDAERALSASVASMSQPSYRGLGDYASLGYVPADKNIESVSKTLEYAYDDWCIYLMAQKMGKKEIAQEFLKRSLNYKNIFKDGFFQPRNADGVFEPAFNPKAYTHHITESNGWQYRFAVQQDVASLVSLMGGNLAFESALDSMFTVESLPQDSLPIFSTGMIGQYAHGNEPSHHVAYLYNSVGRHDKTVSYVNQIMRTQYSALPDGLCGNEDCGQMSAWLVFSAMGFYPVDPASLRYELGVPLFEKITLNGNFTILARGLSAEHYQVERIELNGHELRQRFITWDDISRGGTLEFIIK
ncbi:MAG: GH92 family glycosyl hydrolase [Mucinivorans sp.]